MVAVVAGSMVVGGAVGALVFGAVSATAQSSPPSSSHSEPSWNAGPLPGQRGPFGPGFGIHETVSDLSVAAKAIGISESDLMTALRSGSSIAEVAKQHGVDVQTVIDALVKDAESELGAAVKAGQITQSQADRFKAGIDGRVTAQVNAPGGMFAHRPFGPFGPGRFGGFGPASGASLSVAAKTIGVSEAALVKALRGGSSIAAVAKQHGVTPQKVVATLVADAKSRLNDAVKGGRVTQQQANAIESNLTQRNTAQVNHAGLGCDGPMGRPGMSGGSPGAAYGIPPTDQASA
jgi:transposase-like protein